MPCVRGWILPINHLRNSGPKHIGCSVVYPFYSVDCTPLVSLSGNNVWGFFTFMRNNNYLFVFPKFKLFCVNPCHLCNINYNISIQELNSSVMFAQKSSSETIFLDNDRMEVTCRTETTEAEDVKVVNFRDLSSWQASYHFCIVLSFPKQRWSIGGGLSLFSDLE